MNNTDNKAAPAAILPPELYPAQRRRHQAEVDAFPLVCAFTESDLRKRAAEKLGCDLSGLVSVGLSCFIRKTDRDAWRGMMQRQRDELAAGLASGYDFAKSAFRYELDNHEFSYTRDPSDALAPLGFAIRYTKDEDGYSVPDWLATFDGNEETARAFSDACRESLDYC